MPKQLPKATSKTWPGRTTAALFAIGLVLTPVQLLAQGVGGTAPPPRPGDRGPISNGVGGTPPPARPGQRIGPSSGAGWTAAPANPGAPTGTVGSNGQTGR
jgi:hypothetical protein